MSGTGFTPARSGVPTTMQPPEMHVVDVFAPEKYAGNQLAVFRDAEGYSTERMFELTRETNYSEATFIESTEPRDGGYDVRIFDPVEELPFAGHPTLGTAYVIREFIRDDSPDEIRLNLGVGQIPVTVERDDAGEERFWMRQIPPSFEASVDWSLATRVLSLDDGDVDDRYPVQLVSTGLPTLIVPLRSLDAVRRARTNPEPYYDELLESFGTLNVLVFATETYGDVDLNARVLCDWSTIPEDPATGSANGCLAAYLVEHEYFGGDRVAATVEQGHEVGRPSLLHLRAHREPAGEIAVRVGGHVVPTMDCYLL